MLNKFQRHFIFGRSPKKEQPVLSHDKDTLNKVWIKLDENWGRSVLKFCIVVHE